MNINGQITVLNPFRDRDTIFLGKWNAVCHPCQTSAQIDINLNARITEAPAPPGPAKQSVKTNVCQEERTECIATAILKVAAAGAGAGYVAVATTNCDCPLAVRLVSAWGWCCYFYWCHIIRTSILGVWHSARWHACIIIIIFHAFPCTEKRATHRASSIKFCSGKGQKIKSQVLRNYVDCTIKYLFFFSLSHKTALSEEHLCGLYSSRLASMCRRHYCGRRMAEEARSLELKPGVWPTMIYAGV